MFVQREEGGGLRVGVGAQFVEEQGEGVFVVGDEGGKGGGVGLGGGELGFEGGDAGLQGGAFGGCGGCFWGESGLWVWGIDGLETDRLFHR